MAAPSIGRAFEAREYGDVLSSSREVFRLGEWVYKFDVGPDATGWLSEPQNLREWETYQWITGRALALPERTAVPELVLLTTDLAYGGHIIASRYVEVVNTIPDCKWWDGLCDCYGGREPCWWEMMEGNKAEVYINDLHDNVFYSKDGTYWLLDLGYGSDSV